MSSVCIAFLTFFFFLDFFWAKAVFPTKKRLQNTVFKTLQERFENVVGISEKSFNKAIEIAPYLSDALTAWNLSYEKITTYLKQNNIKSLKDCDYAPSWIYQIFAKLFDANNIRKTKKNLDSEVFTTLKKKREDSRK